MFVLLISLILIPITYYFSFVSSFYPLQQIRNKEEKVPITIYDNVIYHTLSSTDQLNILES